MIPKGLKKGDLFTDGNRKYEVLSVNSDGTYVSSFVSDEDKEEKEISVEGKKYTKSMIKRMKREELDLLCAEYDITVEDTDAKREALIEKVCV